MWLWHRRLNRQQLRQEHGTVPLSLEGRRSSLRPPHPRALLPNSSPVPIWSWRGLHAVRTSQIQEFRRGVPKLLVEGICGLLYASSKYCIMLIPIVSNEWYAAKDCRWMRHHNQIPFKMYCWWYCILCSCRALPQFFLKLRSWVESHFRIRMHQIYNKTCISVSKIR